MISTGPWVSDETWAAVDPRTARLAPKQRRTVALIVALAVVAALVPVFAAVSGLTEPHIGLWPRATTIERSTRSFTVQWHVENEDWFGEKITGVDVEDHGLSVADVSPAELEVPARGRKLLTVHFAVDNCTAASSSGMLVVLHLARPWGTQSTQIVAEQVDNIGTTRQQELFMDGAAAQACGR